VGVLVFIALLLPLNIDCARSGDDPARRTVTRFEQAVAARDWNTGCALLTGRARATLIEEATATRELSPTCTAGLQLAARRERLPSGRIEKVSAPWLWDDATVTTAHGRYRLTTPDQNCTYLIGRLS
jgi:hypothetical protein